MLTQWKRKGAALTRPASTRLALCGLVTVFTASGMTPARAQSCAEPPSGLTSWWRAETNTQDIIGTNHGTLENGATFAAGKVGQAFSLDGVDDRISIPASPTIDLSQKPQWTIAAWVNPSSFTNANWPTIYSFGRWGASLGLNNTTGKLESWVNNNNQLVGTVATTLNQWNFVVMTFDGTNRNFYINGAAAGNGSTPVVGADSNGSAIGDVAGSPNSSRFSGLIDEVDVYTRVLTLTEIQSIYNAGSAGKCLDGSFLAINDKTITENNTGNTSAIFTVKLSSASAGTVTVQYATADGTATAGVDYVSTSGTLTFAPGQTSKTITVPIIGDVQDEDNETFFVNLTNPTNAEIADNQGVGTINDNDAAPTLSIDDATVTEGNSGTKPATFTVSLSEASTRTVTVQYATGTPGSNAATAGTDYTAVPLTTLTFTPGQTTKTFSVLVKGDTIDEVDERFAVNLSGATSATIADNQGFGTIVDDDAVPGLTISDVTLTEGNSGTKDAIFTVTLSAASAKTVTVQYNTATPGTIPATAGSDYVAIPATTLTFAPGETTKTITVLVNGDLLDEDTERFTVNLKSAGNSTITDKEGFCTITDDDAPPSLRINDVSLAEGNSGTTAFTFTVTLSAVSGKTVSVKYQTANPGSLIATPGTDYTAVPLTTLTFAPGQTSKQITVFVNGDTTVEGTERFAVKLSAQVNSTIADTEGLGTITNDDAAPLLFEGDDLADDEPSE